MTDSMKKNTRYIRPRNLPHLASLIAGLSSYTLYFIVIRARIEVCRYNRPARSERTSFAASTFAGLSRFGVSDDSREITLRSCE